MRVTTVAVAIAIAIASSARADRLTVYVQGLSIVPAPALIQAQVLANRIFVDMRVRIDLRRANHRARNRSAIGR